MCNVLRAAAAAEEVEEAVKMKDRWVRCGGGSRCGEGRQRSRPKVKDRAVQDQELPRVPFGSDRGKRTVVTGSRRTEPAPPPGLSVPVATRDTLRSPRQPYDPWRTSSSALRSLQERFINLIFPVAEPTLALGGARGGREPQVPPPVRVKLQRGSARGGSRQLGGGCGQLTNDDKSESPMLWPEVDNLSAPQTLMNPDMLLFSVFN
ncbi:hypothetical protein E2C01_051976 [Portunus trituberculatus]|uniref:Uncharacterized protein n=1 Tax=Portunus trituberculatus TaxID=210409 RepID=A0A5B7GN59_PORTR|nr:hypothetical protein [Portunus trituberculatus]